MTARAKNDPTELFVIWTGPKTQQLRTYTSPRELARHIDYAFSADTPYDNENTRDLRAQGRMSSTVRWFSADQNRIIDLTEPLRSWVENNPHDGTDEYYSAATRKLTALIEDLIR